MQQDNDPKHSCWLGPNNMWKTSIVTNSVIIFCKLQAYIGDIKDDLLALFTMTNLTLR